MLHCWRPICNFIFFPFSPGKWKRRLCIYFSSSKYCLFRNIYIYFFFDRFYYSLVLSHLESTLWDCRTDQLTPRSPIHCSIIDEGRHGLQIRQHTFEIFMKLPRRCPLFIHLFHICYIRNLRPWKYLLILTFPLSFPCEIFVAVFSQSLLIKSLEQSIVPWLVRLLFTTAIEIFDWVFWWITFVHKFRLSNMELHQNKVEATLTVKFWLKLDRKVWSIHRW